MRTVVIGVFIIAFVFSSCEDSEANSDNAGDPPTEILGANILNQLPGHWIGENETLFGPFEWFSFDFRAISPSHVHAIYEGASQQNIIASFFIADYDGKQQMVCRNGGWLFNQYRASYYLLDSVSESSNSNYYRFSDALGGLQRSYIELEFSGDNMEFRVFTSSSGTLPEPVQHMGFVGVKANADLANNASEVFDYPQMVSAVNLNAAFDAVADPNTAAFFEEQNDPFKEADHPYVSKLIVQLNRAPEVVGRVLKLFLSSEPLIDSEGNLNFDNFNDKVLRSIDIAQTEDNFFFSYVHPGTYYLTGFTDGGNNYYPVSGDYWSVSKELIISPEEQINTNLNIEFFYP